MDQRQRARLAFNGLAIFVLGLVIAIPFAIIFTKGNDKHTHLWEVAHLEALVHGLLLMGLGAVGQLIVLPRTHERYSVTLLITGAYSSIVGATIGAIWDVLGVKPGGGVANTVAWLFLGYGTVAVSIAIVWMFWGARRGYETEEDAGRAATKVVEVPQFGPGPRHQEVVETARWQNWGRTQTSEPVRIHRPHSCDELCDRVREARADGFRIKAVGGGYSWSAGAVTDGVLIDMANLDRPIAMTPAERDTPATVTVEAGMTIHALTEYASGYGLTFATTTVIPWVQVGGALGNGCHGTGRDVATLSDLVTALDVVGADGAVTHYQRDDSDTWRALIVSLGGLGIVYSATFECIPMYNVHAVDTTMNMMEAIARVNELASANDCMELFWFPFNDNALVKTWNRTDLPLTEHLPGRAWDDLVQLFDDGLSRPLRRALELDAALTPSVCRSMFALMEKLDVVCPVPWAMQYQTSFAPVVDTSFAIPIDESYDSVRRAWNAGVEQVDQWAKQGKYPQNMVLHARFVGRASKGLLSPSERHELGSCYIEALTFEGTTDLDPYFAELGAKWQALGGRPHWAKLFYDQAALGKLYGENMDRFLAVRARLDPEGVFLNDFLDAVLGLRSGSRSL
jgi:UDP-N-acetylenolpyruvoylglucosamine reductase